jgi:hypothetical protein
MFIALNTVTGGRRQEEECGALFLLPPIYFLLENHRLDVVGVTPSGTRNAMYSPE